MQLQGTPILGLIDPHPLRQLRKRPDLLANFIDKLDTLNTLSEEEVLELNAERLIDNRQSADYACCLGRQVWATGTADQILPDILEVLPRHLGLELVGFFCPLPHPANCSGKTSSVLSGRPMHSSSRRMSLARQALLQQLLLLTASHHMAFMKNPHAKPFFPPSHGNRFPQVLQQLQGSDFRHTGHPSALSSTGSRLGPKSEGGQHDSTFSIPNTAPTDIDVKVVSLCTPASSREPCHRTKRGHTVGNGHGDPSASHGWNTFSKGCSKRSFIRAQHRAAMHGGVVYRGRWCTAASFQVVSKALKPKPANIATCISPKNKGRFVSWNCGGLGMAKCQELQVWLQAHPSHLRSHVVLLQETWWAEDLEYAIPGWNVIRSAGPKRPQGRQSAGVMALISTQLAHPDMIRHSVIEPGRLLHIRINSKDPPHAKLDIINGYQHAWVVPTTNTEDHTHRDKFDKLIYQRTVLFSKLRGLLHQLPLHNRVLIAGDFNAECMPSGSLVGRGQPKHDPSRKSHPDQTTFQGMIEVEQLVALNTWSNSGEQATTFLHANAGCTQIDFALCRLADADSVPMLPLACDTSRSWAASAVRRHLCISSVPQTGFSR